MSGTAERKREPDAGGSDDRLVGFLMPKEASSVESQQGPAVWTGLRFGRRGIHGDNLLQQNFT